MQIPHTSPRHYHSYLLRIWREDDLTPWRIQLEDPHTQEIIGFQNMEKLIRFLEEQAPKPEGDAVENNPVRTPKVNSQITIGGTV